MGKSAAYALGIAVARIVLTATRAHDRPGFPPVFLGPGSLANELANRLSVAEVRGNSIRARPRSLDLLVGGNLGGTHTERATQARLELREEVRPRLRNPRVRWVVSRARLLNDLLGYAISRPAYGYLGSVGTVPG